jgi:hypothetical protein
MILALETRDTRHETRKVLARVSCLVSRVCQSVTSRWIGRGTVG